MERRRASFRAGARRLPAKANERLAELGHETRIDHRSLKDQAIELEPQNKIGPGGARREERGELAERAAEHGAIAQRNGDRIEADPNLALDRAHAPAFDVHAPGPGTAPIDGTRTGLSSSRACLAKVEVSAEVVRLGEDDRGRERFTTRAMLADRGADGAHV